MNKQRSSLSNILRRSPFRQANLRTKLTLGNMLITFIAIIAMGYYVYLRAQESNAMLTSQLETSVRAQVEDDLTTMSKEQAGLLDDFFASMSTNISTIGTIEKSMLTQENLLNTGTYWDASTSLVRLESGSWDNANTEVASIFIPAAVELTDGLASKLNVLKQTELVVPAILKSNPDIIAIYFGGTTSETIYYPNIDLANIVPPDFDVTGRPWYVDAAPAQNKDAGVVWSTPYQDAALNGLVITTSIPVFGEFNQFEGVAAMDIQLNKITSLVSNIHIGKTGYAFLMDKDNRLIALPQDGYANFGVTAETVPLGEIVDETKLTNVSPEFFDVLRKISSGENEVTVVNFGETEYFIAYHQIPEVQYSLAIIVPVKEMLEQATVVNAQITEETTNTIQVSIILIAGILSIATLATLAIGTRLTAPLKSLTNVANEIIEGNINAKADIQSQDEIGTLAETLNVMTSTLRDSIYSLEQRVAERTSALQIELLKGEHRGKQFEAITKVAQAISGTQNLQELLPHISEVVSKQFRFYHVGIFLTDPTNQYAVLAAANSEGGKKMLARGHQLRIGEQGIVGYVTATGQSRIALNVGDDSAFFNNPDLPDTHSEMALPLKIAGKIIGALDVQSTEPNAFSQEDEDVLSALAEQVSLAIQNANLFDQTQKSLAEAEAIYRQNFRNSWERLPKEEKLSGFKYSITGAVPLDDGETGISVSDDSKKKHQVTIPIVLRGETIGTLSVQAAKNEHISTDQSDLIKAVAERVALSAENARLFNETQKRATQLESLNEMGRVISQQIEIKAVLRAAYEQLQRIIQLDAYIVALYDEEKDTVQIPLVIDEGQEYIDETTSPLNRESTTGQVIVTGQPVLRLLTEEEYFVNPEQVGMIGDTSKISASLIYVPLNLGQKTIGVLSIQSYLLNAYTQEQMSLVQNIANQLSIGIQNANLFAEATRRADRERIISDISSKIGTSVRTESILKTTAKELSQLLDGADILIELRTNEQEHDNGNHK